MEKGSAASASSNRYSRVFGGVQATLQKGRSRRGYCHREYKSLMRGFRAERLRKPIIERLWGKNEVRESRHCEEVGTELICIAHLTERGKERLWGT